jgi:predicted nicotinamide N-methyase
LVVTAWVRNPDCEAECDAALFDPIWDADIVGQVVWEPSLVLARHVWSLRGDLPGRRVVELGAGLAVPSIVAAACGACTLATDHSPSALLLAEAAWHLSRPPAPPGTLALRALSWDDPVGPELHHGFHLVLAADVLFATVAAPTLLRTAER